MPTDRYPKLTENFKYYTENHVELAKEYEGKLLVIHDKEVVGSFETIDQALEFALPRYVLGEFLLQKCSADPYAHTMVVHTLFQNLFKGLSDG